MYIVHTNFLTDKFVVTIMYKPVKRFQMKSMDVGMSSIQAYKAHKQEGTLVSKVHKQGALDRHIFPSISTSVAPLHV